MTEAATGGSTEYINHHLHFWQVKVGDGAFMTLNVDTLIFTLVLSVLFFASFRMAARKVTSGVPGKFQAFVEIIVGFVDGLVRRDVRRFVQAIEQWVIDALGELGVESWTAQGRVGIWTCGADGQEAKIGAIGVRLRKWVTMHGLSINVAPDLGHYGGIVPCGIGDLGVTSLAELGKNKDMAALDAALLSHSRTMLAAIGP